MKSTESVKALRARRKAQGLSRFDIYVHPDDWPRIKALAAALQQKRAKIVKPTKWTA